jgi:alpha-amylase
VHEAFAGGKTDILFCDDDLYIIQRRGFGEQKGLVFVLNNSSRWNGRSVGTQWAGTKFIPFAWGSNLDPGTPAEKFTDGNGAADFWAPPRGYVVYVPE